MMKNEGEEASPVWKMANEIWQSGSKDRSLFHGG